tara:strand:- start:256 stop:552 length:297 start_codon:yes stop_codon:yes gene_type:complete
VCRHNGIFSIAARDLFANKRSVFAKSGTIVLAYVAGIAMSSLDTGDAITRPEPFNILPDCSDIPCDFMAKDQWDTGSGQVASAVDNVVIANSASANLD